MKKGFTLIEMLITLAVIGIIVTVFIKTVKETRDDKKKSDYELCQEYKYNRLENQPAMCLKFYSEESKELNR